MNGIKPIKLRSIKKEYIWGTEEWKLSYLHEGFEQVPLLIKKIRAEQALSVQVHPDDKYAKENEGKNGKTEMWYVLDCEPGAYLYYGLKHRISPNEFLKRIHNGTITEVCQKVSVKKGDVFFIPAGLVHAIGAGITVAEIQQSSDITYRVYDYERKDAKNRPRQLHISQAAEVAGFLPPLQGHSPMGLPVKKDGYVKTLLVQCEHFAVYRYDIQEKMQGKVWERPQALLITEGSGSLCTEKECIQIQAEECIYLPEKLGDYEITGTMQILISEALK